MSDLPPRTAPHGFARVREILQQSFWVAVFAFIAGYAFYAIVGGLLLSDLVGLGVGFFVCALLGSAYAWWQHRYRKNVLNDRRLQEARERRGY
jgi:hypothetical protein